MFSQYIIGITTEGFFLLISMKQYVTKNEFSLILHLGFEDNFFSYLFQSLFTKSFRCIFVRIGQQ